MDKYFMYTLLCDHFERRNDTLSKEVLDWIIECETQKSKKIWCVCSEFLRRFKRSGVKQAVIFGAGDYGGLLYNIFTLHEIEILAFIDTFKTGEYMGKKIISPQEYADDFNEVKCAVSIIGGACANRKKISMIFDDLKIKKANIYFMADEWLSYPEDSVSLKLYKESGEPRWFSLPEIYASEKDVFVDIGSNDGKAIDDFINWKNNKGGQYKAFSFEVVLKQYIFQKRKYEADPNIFVNNIGCGKENGQLNFTEYSAATARITNKNTTTKVDVRTVDSLFMNEDITYLKINTVGTECDVIKGAQNTIKRCNPIIGVAIFMDADLWWKIPKLIWSINNNYQFYMRQYPVNATVLYAIPK